MNKTFKLLIILFIMDIIFKYLINKYEQVLYYGLDTYYVLHTTFILFMAIF